VEGVLLDGVRKRGLVPSVAPLRLEVASRTDRGVSARGNALSLTSDLGGGALLRALNGIVPELFFSAVARVEEGFRVRSASQRIYRYYEPRVVGDRSLWAASARRIRGSIDVRSFGRAIPPDRPCWRDVDAVLLRRHRGGLMVEVRARSFVWGMVRKIVGALREAAVGRLSLSRLEAAVAGRERLTLPLAEPEGLVLWDVQYPSIRWETRWPGPNRYQQAFARSLEDGRWRAGAILDALFDDPPPTPSARSPRRRGAVSSIAPPATERVSAPGPSTT
jgi:tRNA pseudouridine38-40 synthase